MKRLISAIFALLLCSSGFADNCGQSLTGVFTAAQATKLCAGFLASTTNVKFGYQAGDSITTAISSTLLGANAGQSITSGNQQTLVGRSAGTKITTGVNNTCQGNRCLAELVSGSNNSVFGGGPMDALIDGNDNSCFGKNCFQDLVHGSANSGFGYGAGWFHSGTSSSNADFGYNSGPCVDTVEQDQLYINNACGTPLIGGNFAQFYMKYKVPTSAPADSVLSTATGYGQVVEWLDESGNKLMFKIKYSTGTVKSGSLNLS